MVLDAHSKSQKSSWINKGPYLNIPQCRLPLSRLNITPRTSSASLKTSPLPPSLFPLLFFLFLSFVFLPFLSFPASQPLLPAIRRTPLPEPTSHQPPEKREKRKTNKETLPCFAASGGVYSCFPRFFTIYRTKLNKKKP